MTIELMFSAANLFALIGYALRQESRITKLETIVALMVQNKNLG